MDGSLVSRNDTIKRYTEWRESFRLHIVRVDGDYGIRNIVEVGTYFTCISRVSEGKDCTREKEALVTVQLVSNVKDQKGR